MTTIPDRVIDIVRFAPASVARTEIAQGLLIQWGSDDIVPREVVRLGLFDDARGFVHVHSGDACWASGVIGIPDGVLRAVREFLLYGDLPALVRTTWLASRPDTETPDASTPPLAPPPSGDDGVLCGEGVEA